MPKPLQESVLLTRPGLEQREALVTIGIRELIPSSTIASAIPKTLRQVKTWLVQHGIPEWGQPFFRFYRIHMGAQYDLEVGYLLPAPVPGDAAVIRGEIPAGTYGVLRYKGKNRGYQGNKALLDWAKAAGIEWDRWDSPAGDHFRCRYEVYLSDIEREPDHKNWIKEVCILVKS
ncbi:MAG: GyrI-like domain-containing protein [Anaerolineales bacterium]|nr:GyrI-like domain-containing protein [Anaerolineales bacterium]